MPAKPKSSSKRPARSQVHALLGKTLRAIREARGLTTRQVGGYSTGHVSNVEAGYVTPSRKYIEVYIQMGGDRQLLRSLLDQIHAYNENASNLRHQSKDTRLRLVPPQDPADVVDHSDVQQHYFTEANDAEYHFNADGVVEEVRLSVKIRAKTAGVRLFYTGHTYDADRREGVLHISDIRGGTLAPVRESVTGAIDAYLILDRVLDPSDADAHVVSWRVLVNTPRRANPQLVFESSPGSRRTSVRARFQPPALPRQIWWFGVANLRDADHPKANRIFEPTPDHTYSMAFDDLTPGWSYGLGWVWEQPERRHPPGPSSL